MCPQRRRDLLGIAAGAATTLATGCLSTTGGSTTDRGDATTSLGDKPATTAPAPDGPTASVDGELSATAWLPAPGVLEGDPYFAFAGDLTALTDADVTEAARRRTRGTFLAVPGEVLARSDVTELATIQSYGTVCSFDADPNEVQSRLEAAPAPEDGAGGGARTATATASAGTDSDADATTTPETTPTTDASTATSTSVDAPDGYEGYATAFGVYWLGADHLLYGREPRSSQAMYDASRGDAKRYASNPDVAAVLDAVGDADLLAFAARSQQAVEGANAFAYAWRFGDVVELAAPFAFPDDASTDADAVAGLADKAGFFEYEQVDVTAAGRVVTFTGELPVSEFDLLERDDGGETPGGDEGTTPRVAFEFEFHQGTDGEWDGDEAERVVLAHTGGDNVDLDTVVVQYDGTAVAERDGFASTEPQGDDWRAGGEWTIRATGADATFESDATASVVWTSDDEERSAVLARTALP